MKLSKNKYICRLFYDYKWEIAYRHISNKEEIVESNKLYEYKTLEFPKGFWGADPFLFEKDGETFVFFEYTDVKKYKSVLAVQKISPSLGDLVVIYEFDVHTSYPCIFEWDNELYIIPETVDASCIQLLRCSRWPYKWEKVCDLISNVKCVDTTFVLIENKPYIQTYYWDEEGYHVYVAELDFTSKCVKDFRIVKSYNTNLGRSGGHFLHSKGNLIRVVQPRARFYGEQIDFYNVKFDGVNYREDKISEFLPEQIKTDKKLNIVGVHTYNRSEHFEVVDLRIDYKFDFFRPIKRVFQIFELFGYGLNDFRHKYINGKYPLHLDNK